MFYLQSLLNVQPQKVQNILMKIFGTIGLGERTRSTLLSLSCFELFCLPSFNISTKMFCVRFWYLQVLYSIRYWITWYNHFSPFHFKLNAQLNYTMNKTIKKVKGDKIKEHTGSNKACSYYQIRNGPQMRQHEPNNLVFH